MKAAKHPPRGKLPYARAVLQTVPNYPPVQTRIEVDRLAIEGAIISVVIANGSCFGGGLRIAPHVDLADGLLDVILGSTGRARAISVFRHLGRGQHLGRPGVLALRGHEIRATPLGDMAMPFDVDGEDVGAAPATIRVLSAGTQPVRPEAEVRPARSATMTAGANRRALTPPSRRRTRDHRRGGLCQSAYELTRTDECAPARAANHVAGRAAGAGSTLPHPVAAPRRGMRRHRRASRAWGSRARGSRSPSLRARQRPR